MSANASSLIGHPGSGPDPEQMSGVQFEPIVGRYVGLEIQGQRYRIYFETAGSGIPVVCLHTAGAHSSQFRHLMCDDSVTSRFQLYAFDLPWHGKSNPPSGWQHETYQLPGDFYVDAIMSFIRGLGLNRPIVMGCSMGGRVVIRLAAQYGSTLGGVIGLEATDVPNPWYDNSWTDFVEFGHPDFCSDLVSSLVAPHSPSEFRWETLWHYFQGGHGVFRGDMAFFRTESDYRELAGQIDTSTCPVYLLTGEYDFSCSPELTRDAGARIPGSKVTIMEGMGHFPMSENPERFSSYIYPILDELLASRAD